MGFIHTAFGPGRIVAESNLGRGRRQFKVEGAGFSTWIDASKIDEDEARQFTAGPGDHVDESNSVALPYNPEPQHDSFAEHTTTIQPDEAGDPEERKDFALDRTHPADSISFKEVSDDEADNRIDRDFAGESFHREFGVEAARHKEDRVPAWRGESYDQDTGEYIEGENYEHAPGDGSYFDHEKGRVVGSRRDLFERPANLDPRYAFPDAPVDNFSPVNQFRADPTTFIARTGHVHGDDLDPATGDHQLLVMADRQIREAAWKDVRQKAVRLRAAGAVHVMDLSPTQIYAAVDGDTGTYDVMIVKGSNNSPALGADGSQAISHWHCGCNWGKWAFKRQMKHVGRLCSHALASYHEMQSAHLNKRSKPELKGNPYRMAAAEVDPRGYEDIEAEEHRPELKHVGEKLITQPKSLVPELNFVKDDHELKTVDLESEPKNEVYRNIQTASLRYASDQDLLRELRALSSAPRHEAAGHMPERNDKIRRAVAELRDRGYDVSNIVAHVRTADGLDANGLNGGQAPGSFPSSAIPQTTRTRGGRDEPDPGAIGPNTSGFGATPRTPADNAQDSLAPISLSTSTRGGRDEPGAPGGATPRTPADNAEDSNAPITGLQAPGSFAPGMAPQTTTQRGGRDEPDTPSIKPLTPGATPDAPGGGGAPGSAPKVNQSGDAAGPGAGNAPPLGGSGGGSSSPAPGIGGAGSGESSIGAGTSYDVKAGDTLSDIAQRSGYGGDYKSLGDANGITDYDKIDVGQKINIGTPGGGGGSASGADGILQPGEDASGLPGGVSVAEQGANLKGTPGGETLGVTPPAASAPSVGDPSNLGALTSDPTRVGARARRAAFHMFADWDRLAAPEEPQDAKKKEDGTGGTVQQPTEPAQPAQGGGGLDGMNTFMTMAQPFMDAGANILGDVGSSIGNSVADSIGGGISHMFGSRYAAYPEPGDHQPFNGSGPVDDPDWETSEDYVNEHEKKYREDIDPKGKDTFATKPNDPAKTAHILDLEDPYRTASSEFYTDMPDDSATNIVAQFQRQAGWIMGGGSQPGNADIADNAARFLRTAGRKFSEAEQDELINERAPGGARNLASLNLEGTHYLP